MPQTVQILPGDGFMVDSNKSGPKWVKFFMTAQNWIVHLWRKFKGTQEVVQYYHVGMFENADSIIEQQWKVRETSSDKLLNTSNKLMIFRKKSLDGYDRDYLVRLAKEDLGKGYDVLNIIGKTLTWVTCIPLFGMYLQWPGVDVCVNRYAYWMLRAFKDKFGQRTHSDLTTHELYKYIKSHPEEWEVVFEGVPKDNLRKA